MFRTNSQPARTVVVKVGTSSLCDPETCLPKLATVAALVEALAMLRIKCGHKVVLVTSGAVGMGLRRMNLTKRPKEVQVLQACAAVGQPELMNLYTQLFGDLGVSVAQILLGRGDIAQHRNYINACNTLKTLLDTENMIPIVNENDAVSVSQLKFGDNDTLSAMVAGMVQADFLFLLTDVDAVYTDNPRTNPDATPVREVENLPEFRTQVDVDSAGSDFGTGGMTTKLNAADLATSAGVTMIIGQSSDVSKMMDTVNEADTATAQSYGTTFLPATPRVVERKWWIHHGLVPRGKIFINQIAASALTKHKAPLYASGIVKVEGKFLAEQAVNIYEKGANPDEDEPIARGTCEYSSTEIQQVKGMQSECIPEILGYSDADHIIHRDNLVILHMPIKKNRKSKTKCSETTVTNVKVMTNGSTNGVAKVMVTETTNDSPSDETSDSTSLSTDGNSETSEVPTLKSSAPVVNVVVNPMT